MGRRMTVQGDSAPNPHIVHGLTVFYFNRCVYYIRHLYFLNCSFACLNFVIFLRKLMLPEAIS